MHIALEQRSLNHFWERIIAPHPSITDVEQRRQSRLLATIVIALTVLVAATGIRQIYLNLTFQDQDWETVLATTLEVVLAIPIIYLNHVGRYKLSARALIVLAFALTAFLSRYDNTMLQLGALIVVLSAIFLSYRDTIIVVAVVLGAHFLWSWVQPVVTSLIINAYVSTLVLVFVRFRFHVEQERQQELRDANDRLRQSEAELQHANATLEQKVKDRTSALEQAKEEAERANHVKSAFLASMSHELRTPLNAIINFTKFVAKGDMGPVNELQAGTLTEVIDSAKHLLALINDVLDMSKIEAGSLNLFIEDDVDLTTILETVETTAGSLLADKPVALEVEIEHNLPRIRGDRQRILQILLNVMSNACKFTQQGNIGLVARQVGQDIVMAVQDTGPGIAPEDQSLVFEAFKQTHTGLRQGGGTGLGMPISRNLTEAHGGRLWLESEVGRGTTFFVSLPIQSEQLVPLFSAAEVAK